jgi:hypothetical protein
MTIKKTCACGKCDLDIEKMKLIVYVKCPKCNKYNYMLGIGCDNCYKLEELKSKEKK